MVVYSYIKRKGGKALDVLVFFFGIYIFLYIFIVGVNTIVIKSVFVVVILYSLYFISTKGVKEGFNKLIVKRNIINARIAEGEETTVELVIENRKRMPITFLLIEELLPKEFKLHNKANISEEYNGRRHKIKGSIYGYERRKKIYKAKIYKRGVYFINDMDITIGDIFGIATNEKSIKDRKEVVVYPKIKEINEFKFKDKNIMGENIVKRWIHTDPIFIKGIREYAPQDRMKDIHWNATMKQNKLMVKEYDYSSDKEMMIILSTQCHKECFSYIYSDCIDNGINIAVAIANQCIQEGISIGMWTNACIRSMNFDAPNEIKPNSISIEPILELCARADYISAISLEEQLAKRIYEFKENTVYVLITPYLSKEAIGIIYTLSRRGITFKIIDVSRKRDIPHINGIEIEKIDFIEKIEQASESGVEDSAIN